MLKVNYQKLVDRFNFDAPSAFQILTREGKWLMDGLRHAINLPDAVSIGLTSAGIELMANDLTLVLEVSESLPGGNVIVEGVVYDHANEVRESWGLHKLNYAPDAYTQLWGYAPKLDITAWQGFANQIRQWAGLMWERDFGISPK